MLKIVSRATAPKPCPMMDCLKNERILLANSPRPYPVGLSLENRDVRVGSWGMPSNQAASRLRFIAAPVITCCRCALARPM